VCLCSCVAYQALLCANPVFRDFHNRNRNLAEFKEIVEVYVEAHSSQPDSSFSYDLPLLLLLRRRYVLNRLHAKLWDDFTTLFAKEDNDLLSLASSLKNLRQSDVGTHSLPHTFPPCNDSSHATTLVCVCVCVWYLRRSTGVAV
jgi:hypothetical protein